MCQIVTLDGTLLARNGNITGGGVSSDEQRSSTWDDRDYQRNKAERDRLLKEREDLDRTQRGSEALQTLRVNMAGLENRITNVRLDLKLSHEKLTKEQTEAASIQVRVAVVASGGWFAFFSKRGNHSDVMSMRVAVLWQAELVQKEKELSSLLDQLGLLNARLEVLDKKIREQHEEV